MAIVAVGKLSAKITKYCTICNSSYRRSMTAKVLKDTPEEIEKARAEIRQRAAKEYTCKVCKSIQEN